MVFVTRDGTVHKDQPWGFGKVMTLLNGIVNMIIAFFQTMIPIENSNPRNNFRNSGGWRSGGSGGGGGGGGSNPRPGGGQPGGNIHGMHTLPPNPPPACGSCCGR